MGETTQDAVSAGEATAAYKPRKRHGRIVAFRIAEILFLLLLLPVVVVVIALVLATDNRLQLPQGVETQIITRVDEAVLAFDIDVDGIEIALPEGRFTPEFVLSGVAMRDEAGLRAFVPEISVTLNGQALLRGELRPRRVRLDQAGVRFTRDRDGVIDLALSTGRVAETLGVPETLARIDAVFAEPTFSELEEISGAGLVLLMSDEITGQLIQSQDAEMVLEAKDAALTLRLSGSVAASRDGRVEIAVTRNPDLGRNDFLFSFENLAARDLASASPALRWLDFMRAPISGRLVGRVSDDGRIGDVSGSLDIGPGEFLPRDELEPIPLDRVAAEIRFDAAADRLAFEELILDSEPLSFTASGQADVFEDGRVLVGQLQFSNLTAAPEGLFSAPLEFEGGALDLRLSFAPALDLQIGQAVLFDDGLRIQAWGSVAATEAGLETRIDARIPQLAATDLFPYWPAFIIPGTRDWVTENLTDGQIEGFAASFRRGPGGPQTGIRFDFRGLELSPLDGMPPITNGAGFLSVLNERLSLVLTEAQVVPPNGDAVDLSGSTMLLGDTRTRNPRAQFDLEIAGSIPAVGSLLALPPVDLLADSPRDPGNLATGFVEAEAQLVFDFRRRVPREDISFTAAGELREVRADTLVPGRVLTAERLDLTVTPEFVALAGRGALDGVAATTRWSQPLVAGEGSRAEGRVTVNAETLARFGVTLPAGMLSGSGGADFSVDIPRIGPPELRLRSDLAGIGLAIPGLPWRLSQAGTGSFEMRAILDAAPQVPELSLQAAGLDLAASVDLRPEGGFRQLDIARGRIGNWLDVAGSVAPGQIRVTGGNLDLRELSGPTTAATGGNAGIAIAAQLDTLTLADGIALTGASADLAPSLSGNFSGRVNGGASLAGALSRTAQGLAITITAADAGAVLRSAGVIENGYGGSLGVALQPTGAPGAYDGRLTIDGARLRDAPAMADLLNAISVVGLLEQLGGEGINLGQLEAGFRVRPGVIILDEGTAVGPSMGISMDGVLNTATGAYDMQGVISPVYIVNGIAGALFAPRREGLFGFTYRLEGTADAASVSVNPLSILTPGIFREIFRRPPPEIAQQ
ncbi:MAG: AsmA-like C-terminal region-containing protein [Pseudomonadota bacterium]